jgi:hypothetical protein
LANSKAQNATFANNVDAGSTFAEKHFSPKELATLWGLRTDAVRRIFSSEEGVLLIPSRNPSRSMRSKYNTMLIPESVVKRVHARYSVGKRNPNRYGYPPMIYRRHRKSCSQRPQKLRYWQCQCPCWADFRKNGIRVHKSMNLTDFEKARALEELWILGAKKIFGGEISGQEKGDAKPITVAEAWQKFLGQAKARKLSRASIYKYNLLRRRMEDFAKRQGLYLLRDFNADVLELFQSEWTGGPKPKPRPTLPFTHDEMSRILATIEVSRQIA